MAILRRNWKLLWNLGVSNRVHAMAITFIAVLTANVLHNTALSFGFSWLIGAALFAVLAVLSRVCTRFRD